MSRFFLTNWSVTAAFGMSARGNDSCVWPSSLYGAVGSVSII